MEEKKDVSESQEGGLEQEDVGSTIEQSTVREQEMEEKNRRSTGGTPVGVKIIIGVLSVMVVALLGYLMYQVGRKSASPEEVKDNMMMEDKNGDVEENVVVNDNKIANTDSLSSKVENDEVQEVIDKNSLEAKDINALEEELGGISDKYDDLKSVETDLDNWSN